MGHFKQYDEATAKYHQDLNIKTTPIFSWDFHYGFLSELKNTFIDLNKLNGISSLGRWSQNNWDFKEILKEEDNRFDFVCCCVGTGGTISGLINSALPNQKILGFPALKGDFLTDEIRIFAKKDNWNLISDYHFGGYGKINEELVVFLNQNSLTISFRSNKQIRSRGCK